MSHKRLLWRLYPTYLLVVLSALFAVSAYSSRSFRVFYLGQIQEDLGARVFLIEETIKPCFLSGDYGQLDRMCKDMERRGHTRITVILRSGEVVADSNESPEKMSNHADRVEIIDAFKSGRGISYRYSETLQKQLVYYAIPIVQGGQEVAVLRVAVPLTPIYQELDVFYKKILFGALVVSVFVAVISLMISRRITKPVERMTQLARRFSVGDLRLRMDVPDTAELAALAETLNSMAQQLDDRIETVTRGRNELEAVFTSMAEGVLAVDKQGGIVSINKAAAAMFNVNLRNVQGRKIFEITANQDLQRFVETTLLSDTGTEAEMVMDEGSRIIRLQGGAIFDGPSHRRGAVVVLDDITRLRKLENMRRDFVANVSHELKTPITSIKGFVETLQESFSDDPEQTGRFLEIIARQTDRLNAIIEDLLSLSRLEQGSNASALAFQMKRVEPVLRSAIELTQLEAERKSVRVDLDCDRSLQAVINSDLLEQAVVNLIGNAIKYSSAGQCVTVVAGKEEGGVSISVSDQGCGISERDQSQIFERFYVVDKARSRKLGGTGLGLAIVKHIVQVHHGTVGVVSTPGEGSRFTLNLPFVTLRE
ncbi:MAG: cell wall metabolism sensor histidine kinase WalK [Phycisphaerae bacterium]|nr:cell wall metabolism sensor histidine kinase WalK [Phycisphaerae bacterium]